MTAPAGGRVCEDTGLHLLPAAAETAYRVAQDKWAQVEYPALMANPHVKSITAVNPATGSSHVLWRHP